LSAETVQSATGRGSRVRVVHFADMVNRHDFIHNVAAHCDRVRVDLSVVTLDARGTLNSDPGNLRVHDLGCTGRMAYPRALLRLRHLLRRERVAILHSHHFEPSLLAAVATFGLPTRLVLGRHYSDTIHKFSRGLRRRLYLGLEGFCNARASVVVAPSTVVERILMQQGVAPSKIARIPYGLDLGRFEVPAESVRRPLEQEWPANEGLRLLTVGRLHPEKGQEYLLEAVVQLLREGGTATRLLLVGDGPDHKRLAAIAGELGIANATRFLGWRSDVLALMATADVVVQPTLNEAFSQVMLEAMAMGRALVMTDVGGVRDVIEDGVSGLVVPIRDAGALAAAIRALGDRNLRARLGGNAAQRIRDRLDVRRIVRQFETLYLRVAGDGDTSVAV